MRPPGARYASSQSPGYTVDETFGSSLILLALLGGSLALLLLGVRLWWLPAHAPLNVNEGWNALHAAQAIAGEGLYPLRDGLTANNYPPLSFYLVGAAGQMLGDNIIAGRIVSLCAELAVGIAIFATVRGLTRSREAAWVGVLLFAGFAATMLRRYTAMNDPQWLALAFTTGAMALVVRASRPEPRHRVALVTVAAALTVLGVFTKQNTVAIPIALTCWLWLADRRLFAVWCGVGAALGLGALSAFAARWGQSGVLDVVLDGRSYSPGRMLAKGLPDLLVLAPGTFAYAAAWRRARPKPALPLLLLVTALLLGLLQRAGAGVDINAFFEGVVALSVAVPVACVAMPGRRVWFLALTALPVVCLAPVAIRDDVTALITRDPEVRRWKSLVAGIAAAKGPVACDDQAVCYWAARAAGIDFFATKQRLLVGRGDSAKRTIACRRFAMIEMRINDPSWHDDLLRPLITANYVPVFETAGRALLAPRQPPLDTWCADDRATPHGYTV